MANFSKLFKFPFENFIKKVRILRKYVEYLNGTGYCWLNLYDISLGTKVLLLERFPKILAKVHVVELFEHFLYNKNVCFKPENGICHVEWTREEKTFEQVIRLISVEERFGANYQQVSKSALYSVTNVTQRDCIGFEAASGGLGNYSKRMVQGALVVPYSCTLEEQNSIMEAISNRLILFEQPGKRVSHPHLKFLSEFLDDSVLGLNMRGKHVKILGPKFDKKEAKAYEDATSIHFCTYYPSKLDKRRGTSSSDALTLEIMKAEDIMAEYSEQIQILRKELGKKPGSNYVQEISAQIRELSEKFTVERKRLIDFKAELDALRAEDDFVSKRVCNVGAENCEHKADKIIALHSLYDMNLPKLLENCEKCEANELIVTLHLPFGLLFVERYFSPETGVTYVKDGKGFLMIHGGDLSNGYAHAESAHIMELMKSSFVHTKTGDWSYEIVDSIAEICKLRFTKASKGERIVRKLMPPKFDKYRLIMNPLDYFGPIRKRTPMFVDSAKLESAIKYVKRSKNNKEIIENLFAYVQSLFMRVVVGNTELQAGGSVASYDEDAIVLAALIEGSIRKHLVGTAYKKSFGSRGWMGKILDCVLNECKTLIGSLFPGCVKFFTTTTAEKYLEESIDLSTLILDSSSRNLDSLVGYLSNLRDGVYRGFSEYFDSFPTLYDVLKSGGNLKTAFCKADNTEVGLRLLELTGCREHAEDIKLQKKLDQLKRNATSLDYDRNVNEVYELGRKFYEEQIIPEIEEALIEDSKSETSEESSSSFSTLADIKVVRKTELGEEEEFEEVPIDHVEIPFHEHHALSEEHLRFRMDGLTRAALAFNVSRAKLIREGKGEMSGKDVTRLVDKFTRKGKVVNACVNQKDIDTYMRSLENGYFVECSTVVAQQLLECKEKTLKAIEKVRADGSLETINEKQVEVINGYAGSGKTRRILEEFDVTSDAYVSPLSEILKEFYDELKHVKAEDMQYCKRKDMVKTFERIVGDEKKPGLKRSGRVLFIDEASKFCFGFLLFILAYTNYDKYVFVGDAEQSGHFDPTGMAGNLNFTHLVPSDAITRYFYTFRYGPSVAGFVNKAFNYPVFSLRKKDTRVVFNSLDNFTEAVKGTNITITSDTVDEYAKNFHVSNIKTAVSMQGITAPVVNLILAPRDEVAAVSFRANGIVAATRVTEELNIFVDHVSKKTKLRTTMEDIRENFAHLFDIVIPNESDF